MKLAGKVALVTGAAGGIGLAICKQLATEGCKIVANVWPPETEEVARRELKAQGDTLTIVGNVAVADEVQATFEQTMSRFGRLDVLVNNAGITRDSLLLRMSEQDWDEVLEVNLKGTFLCLKEAARIMSRQRGGRIINISSVVGLTGNVGQCNYAASKAGIIALTKSAAKELAGRGVTVNAIAPGFIDTPMTARLSEKGREALLSQIPLRRIGTLEDVAKAVVFLASPDSSYITGHVLNVDGGMVLA